MISESPSDIPGISKPAEDTADVGGRDTDRVGYLLAGPALAAQFGDPLDLGWRGWLAQAVWPRAAVDQPAWSFGPKAGDLFAEGFDANSEGRGHGLRRLSGDHPTHHDLSTRRRQRRILMDVHSAPPAVLKLQQLQLPRSGPGGQPMEKLTASAYAS